jgi:hypothetical protein
MKELIVAIGLLALFLTAGCRKEVPVNPKFKLAQVVQVKGFACQGTVIQAYNYGNSWSYAVAFDMKCPTCKEEPDFLTSVQVVVFEEKKLEVPSPAQPLKKPEPNAEVESAPAFAP